MSIHEAPHYSPPSHGDALRKISPETANFVDMKIDNSLSPEIWETVYDRLDERCNDFMDVVDEYIETVPDELWEGTSVYSGNTRGALKIQGVYPAIDVYFDINEWETPKVLTNLVTRVITAQWRVKGTKKHPKNEVRSKTYTYAPGALKVKITGEDYAPRIPMPPHGGGDKYMLQEVYDEIKSATFERIAKRKGF